MKKLKIIDISRKLNVSHSAVSQWLSGTTRPTAEKMFLLEDYFGIPLGAWRDIRSYLESLQNESNTLHSNTKSIK